MSAMRTLRNRPSTRLPTKEALSTRAALASRRPAGRAALSAVMGGKSRHSNKAPGAIIGHSMTVTVREWDDGASWNAFVASTPHAHFQQSWQWGEIAPRLGGHAVRLGAECDGKLVAAAQVFVHEIRGINRRHLYIPRGPASVDNSLPLIGPLMAEAEELGRCERAVGIRVEPNAPADDTELTTTFKLLGLAPAYPPSQPRSSWVLDLRPKLDDLMSGMKSKTRYNIRLAERKGVEIEVGTAADIPVFYGLLKETAA